jgi:tRNA A-37 threonylcarbamoyl transferase component Bud32
MPSPDEPAAPPTSAPGATTVVAPPGTPGNNPLIGTVLAERYEIVRRIGEGGMGAVYEGKHTVLGRQVAVKVLLEKFLEKTELVARLLQEARLASAIGHENIVDVTDFGTTADGRSYVVMEFLEGESLAQVVMRDAPLAVDRCLRIARQVVSALVAAHDKGIVHRDIKPENVFLLRRGEQDFVKVVDFGVSKAVRSRDDGQDLLRLTRTGMVLGTPLYMSPEQARGGDDVDVRADVWAVGVMLYECLTGEVPFRANNYLGVISQVLTQEVQPPSKLRPELGIPPAVEAVVMRAMEKDRERRYQKMSDLERDLDRLMAGDPNVGISETAPALSTEPKRTSARWHLGIFAVLVVGIGLAFTLARTEEERRSAPARAAKAALKAKTTPPRAAPKPAATAPAAPAAAAPVTAGTAGTTGSLLTTPPPEDPSTRRPGKASQSARKKQAAPPKKTKAVDDVITDPEKAFPK